MVKMTEEQFVTKALAVLPQEGRKGIHSVYSGFNKAFKEYFKKEARATTDAMAAKALITVRPCKGGVMIYPFGEGPKDAGAAVLAKILAE